MVRRNSALKKNLKDYLVPIIGLFLIFILIFSVFGGGDNSGNSLDTIDSENRTGFNISIDSDLTESYIVYPGDYKKKIEGEGNLYKGEKIIVKEGSVSLDLLTLGNARLNKLGELKYLENGNFNLLSSDLWINSSSSMKVDLRYAKIQVGENSNIAFSQNEMGSTVYLLNGFAEVSNLAGKTTVLSAGSQITVSRGDASSDSVDLSLAKSDIDDFYKQSDWFIRNNGSFYLQAKDLEDSATGSTLGSSLSSSNSSYLAFNNLVDESQVSGSSISVTGVYSDETIASITLNGISASLDKEKKTFAFKDVSTAKKVNDLIFKVIDDSGDILEKKLFTVYYDGGSSSTSASNAFSVKTFDVDATNFTFTSPTTTNSYTTYEMFVTIRGDVKQKGISKVTVNGYQLNSFNGSTWRYHAAVQNENLKNGTNIYEIKYFNDKGELAYTNSYIIVKKVKGAEEKEEDIISDEA